MSKNLVKVGLYGALILLLGYLAARPITSIDLWMHLAVGRTIGELKSIPATDLFCYPTLGHPYIYFEWLYQVGLYLGYLAFGLYSFELIKYLLWGGTLLFFYLTVRRLTPHLWIAFLLTFLTAFWLRIRVSAAPDNCGYFFFSFFIYIIVLYRRQGKNLLWLLPLAQILWINIHLSALLGPVLVGFELLDRLFWRYFPGAWRKKSGLTEPEKSPALLPVFILWVSLILACLVTPYFHKTLTFIAFYIRHQREIQHWIIEWRPLHHFLLFWPFLLSFALLLWSVVRGWRHLGPFPLLGILYFSFMSFSSSRFFPYFILGTLPFLSLGLASLDLPSWGSFKQKSRRAVIHAAVIMILLAVNMLWLMRFQGGPNLNFGFADFYLPRQATAFIERTALPGRLFNHMDFGGYLEWRLYPRVMPFVDARIPNPAVFVEHMHILQEPMLAGDLLDKYGINYIVTKSCAHGSGRLWPLIEYLYHNPQWALIFADDRSLIFLRDIPPNRPWLEKYRLPKEMIYREIVTEVQGFKALGQKGGFWDWTLAYAAYKSKNYPESRAALRRWLAAHPQDKEAQRILQELEKIP